MWIQDDVIDENVQVASVYDAFCCCKYRIIICSVCGVTKRNFLASRTIRRDVITSSAFQHLK